jgi:hypothetical protein
MTYGKKRYEVLSLYFCGERADWDQAQLVEARDYREAAETWAEEDDQLGEYTIITRGEHGPVRVRLEGEKEYKTFTIFAESCPQYTAQEVSKL